MFEFGIVISLLAGIMVGLIFQTFRKSKEGYTYLDVYDCVEANSGKSADLTRDQIEVSCRNYLDKHKPPFDRKAYAHCKTAYEEYSNEKCRYFAQHPDTTSLIMTPTHSTIYYDKCMDSGQYTEDRCLRDSLSAQSFWNPDII